MTTFNEREKGEERKFAMDEESQFMARARRDRFVGHWAAEKLGLAGDDASAYAKNMQNLDLDKHNDAALITKLKSDFAAKNVAVTEQEIVAVMQQKMNEAIAQIKAGQK